MGSKRMEKGRFFRETTITFSAGVINLACGIGTSVILARVLETEGRGIYAVAMLLNSLVLTFGSMGVGPAIVYYVARKEFRCQEMLGNNILLAAGISGIGVLGGLVVVVLFGAFFPGVPYKYLLLALVLVPPEILFSHLNYMLLGAQRIKEFNYSQIIRSALFLVFIILALIALRTGVTGALLAGLFAWLLGNVIALRFVKMFTEGIDFKPNFLYIKRVVFYGVQAHFANVLAFLNYRVSILLINNLLGVSTVGIYAIVIDLAERLWMLSYSASTVLFPRVAAEIYERKRADFTPLVARTIFWTTAFGALLLALLGNQIVPLLYSDAFSAAVPALQASLGGIVALSAGRVLANDLAGRGLPICNIYTGLAALLTNLILNYLWIQRLGIVGAAWASTVSYIILFLGTLFFYCRFSGVQWTRVIFLQQGDWALYWQSVSSLGRWAWEHMKAAL